MANLFLSHPGDRPRTRKYPAGFWVALFAGSFGLHLLTVLSLPLWFRGSTPSASAPLPLEIVELESVTGGESAAPTVYENPLAAEPDLAQIPDFAAPNPGSPDPIENPLAQSTPSATQEPLPNPLAATSPDIDSLAPASTPQPSYSDPRQPLPARPSPSEPPQPFPDPQPTPLEQGSPLPDPGSVPNPPPEAVPGDDGSGVGRDSDPIINNPVPPLSNPGELGREGAPPIAGDDGLQEIGVGNEPQPVQLQAQIIELTTAENIQDIPGNNAEPLTDLRTLTADPTDPTSCIVPPNSIASFGQVVSFRLWIDSNGQVQEVFAADGSDNPDYLELARCIVQGWQFAPAMTDGMPHDSDNLVLSIAIESR